MSLLEQAKQHKIKQRVSTSEERELAIAWIRGEITNAQVSKALTKKSNQTASLYKLSFAMRDLYHDGIVIIK